jgi:hypothetical protein
LMSGDRRLIFCDHYAPFHPRLVRKRHRADIHRRK